MSPLDQRRSLFLAFICVQLVCYQSALITSDATHLMSTMIALPFILVLGALEMPAWAVARGPRRWAARAAFIVLAVMVYPAVVIGSNATDWRAPVLRFQAGSADAAAVAELSRPGEAPPLPRLRPLTAKEPIFFRDDSVSVAQFAAFVSEVHSLVGRRKTYLVRVGWIAGGLIAYLADLMPAPHPYGGDLLTVNDAVREQVAEHMRQHPQDYEAFIGPSLVTPEAAAFLDSHPETVRLERRLAGSMVHILLARQ